MDTLQNKYGMDTIQQYFGDTGCPACEVHKECSSDDGCGFCPLIWTNEQYNYAERTGLVPCSHPTTLHMKWHDAEDIETRKKIAKEILKREWSDPETGKEIL